MISLSQSNHLNNNDCSLMVPSIWGQRLEKSSHKLPPCPRLAETVDCQVGRIKIKVIFHGNGFPSPSLATTLSTRNAYFLALPLSSRKLVDGDNHDLHYKGYFKSELFNSQVS